MTSGKPVREAILRGYYYYHAGVELEPGRVWWSDHTRRSLEAAVQEARRLARRMGGRPVVEYWRRDRGMRPGDADAVVGAAYVDGGDA